MKICLWITSHNIPSKIFIFPLDFVLFVHFIKLLYIGVSYDTNALYCKSGKILRIYGILNYSVSVGIKMRHFSLTVSVYILILKNRYLFRYRLNIFVSAFYPGLEDSSYCQRTSVGCAGYYYTRLCRGGMYYLSVAHIDSHMTGVAHYISGLCIGDTALYRCTLLSV